jgi:hypothetical protein
MNGSIYAADQLCPACPRTESRTALATAPGSRSVEGFCAPRRQILISNETSVGPIWALRRGRFGFLRGNNNQGRIVRCPISTLPVVAKGV